MEQVKPDTQVLIDIVNTQMPFGKYKGTYISDMPIHYLEWLKNKGLPPGKLGMMLSTVYEIKANGLNTILLKIRAVYKTK